MPLDGRAPPAAHVRRRHRARGRAGRRTGEVLYATRALLDAARRAARAARPADRRARRSFPWRRPATVLTLRTAGRSSSPGSPFQGSHTKRYKGGTAQSLWKLAEGAARGRAPHRRLSRARAGRRCGGRGRVYFASDRDGTMNLWSMDERGGDLRPAHHATRAGTWPRPSLSDGRIVYQLGADLRLFDIAHRPGPRGSTSASPPTSTRRASLGQEARSDFLTSIALVAEGRPRRPHRARPGVRGPGEAGPARGGDRAPGRPLPRRALPAGRQVALGALRRDRRGRSSWTLARERRRRGAAAHPRRQGAAVGGACRRPTASGSPTTTRTSSSGCSTSDERSETKIDDRRASATSRTSPGRRTAGGSPTSRPARTASTSIFLYGVDGRSDHRAHHRPLRQLEPRLGAPTGDGSTSSPTATSNRSSRRPWGPRQPEPFLDRPTEIYGSPSRRTPARPSRPPTSCTPSRTKRGRRRTEDRRTRSRQRRDVEARRPGRSTIDLDGIAARLSGGARPAGQLRVARHRRQARCYWLSVDTTARAARRRCTSLAIGREKPKLKTLLDDVKRVRALRRRQEAARRARATTSTSSTPATRPRQKLEKAKVDLSRWTFSFDPREEWRQMFVEAWRLERDYFYDRGDARRRLDGDAREVPAARGAGHQPGRAERRARPDGRRAVGALHMFVRGGDLRKGAGRRRSGLARARELVRDEAAGRLARRRGSTAADPDQPDRLSPLGAARSVGVPEGDVIESINGVTTLSVPDPAALLRGQAGRQVLLRVRPAGPRAADATRWPIPLDA